MYYYYGFLFFVPDSGFANQLKVAAESLYSFAKTYTGKYTDCVHDAGDFYRYGCHLLYETLFYYMLNIMLIMLY